MPSYFNKLIHFLKPHLKIILGIVFIVAVWYIRVNSPGITWFNTHMSRDFSRALDILSLSHLPSLGPELNYSGGRLFGPGLYYLIALFWLVTHSLPLMLALIHTLTVILSFRLFYVLIKDLGFITATFFFLTFILMPVQVLVSRTLWNPSLIVPFNIIYILLLRDYLKAPKTKYLVIFFLTAFIGTQIHLSLFVGFFVGLTIIWLNKGLSRKVTLASGVLILYTLLVLTFNKLWSPFVGSVVSQYSVNLVSLLRILSFFKRMLFHIFLTPQSLADYELFPLIFNFGKILLPKTFSFLLNFTRTAYLFDALFIISLVVLFLKLGRKHFSLRQLDFYEQLVFFWLIFCSLPLLFFTGKGGIIPYRYGLMFYPLQFLVVPLALRYILKLEYYRIHSFRARVISGVFLGYALFIFLGNAIFLLSSYEVMKAAGRVSHVQEDNFEIPLEYKMRLLSFAKSQVGSGDPYLILHGPIVNKVRMNEYDWNHREYFSGILKSLPRTSPVILELDPPHYLVESFSLNEMKANVKLKTKQFPFHLYKLGQEDLPSNLTLSYLDALGKAIFSRPIPDKGMILPLDLEASIFQKAVYLKLKFNLLTSDKKYLRLCFDAHSAHRTLVLESAIFDGAKIDYKKNNPGWLEQQVIIFALPQVSKDNGLLEVEINFRIAEAANRFSRVDIYKTLDNYFYYER